MHYCGFYLNGFCHKKVLMIYNVYEDERCFDCETVGSNFWSTNVVIKQHYGKCEGVMW